MYRLAYYEDDFERIELNFLSSEAGTAEMMAQDLADKYGGSTLLYFTERSINVVGKFFARRNAIAAA